jgi:hypothetical protein
LLPELGIILLTLEKKAVRYPTKLLLSSSILSSASGLLYSSIV